MAFQLSFNRQPSFGVSIHCIVLFLVRLLLLVIVSLWSRRRAIQKIRAWRGVSVHLLPWLEGAAKVLSVWMPVRLMCPGAIMKIGQWTCRLSDTLLPASLDIFNGAANSRSFWMFYAWLEIGLYCTIVYTIYAHNEWPHALGIGKNWKYLLWKLGHLKFRRGRAAAAVPDTFYSTFANSSYEESDDEEAGEDLLSLHAPPTTTTTRGRRTRSSRPRGTRMTHRPTRADTSHPRARSREFVTRARTLPTPSYMDPDFFPELQDRRSGSPLVNVVSPENQERPARISESRARIGTGLPDEGETGRRSRSGSRLRVPPPTPRQRYPTRGRRTEEQLMRSFANGEDEELTPRNATRIVTTIPDTGTLSAVKKIREITYK